MEEQIKALQEAFEGKLKHAASQEQMETLKSELTESITALELGVNEDRIKEVTEDFDTKLKAQWDEVKGLFDTPAEKPLTLREALKAEMIKNDSTEEYVDVDGDSRYRIKGGDQKGLAFHIKAVVDMNTANAVRPGASPGVNIGYLTDYGMNDQQISNTMNNHFMLAGFSAESTVEKYYGVLVETTEVDGAAIKTETTVAGGSSYLWKTIEYKVFDFSVKFRIHQNTLDDMENVLNRVTTIGVDRLLSVIDTSTLYASGDNSATPYGLRTTAYHTDYDGTLRQGEVQAANIVNVIKNAVLQANNAEEEVDTLIINRNDASEIEDLKDGNDNTINLAGVKVDDTGKLSYIYGLKVIINNKMTADQFIVCKLSDSIQYGVRKQVGLRLGYDLTTDFSKNIVTAQLDMRLAIGLGKPEAIIYCSGIAAAASSLTVVEA